MRTHLCERLNFNVRLYFFTTKIERKQSLFTYLGPAMLADERDSVLAFLCKNPFGRRVFQQRVILSIKIIQLFLHFFCIDFIDFTFFNLLDFFSRYSVSRYFVTRFSVTMFSNTLMISPFDCVGPPYRCVEKRIINSGIVVVPTIPKLGGAKSASLRASVRGQVSCRVCAGSIFS